jgi:tRNA (adenine37-N6)-methyltransferase
VNFHIYGLHFFFHQVPENKKFSTKVRPPRLGGNITKGIFATRSPFRPNRLGLSVVRLLKVDYDSQKGISLIIEGADVVNGTPIIDVKPYIKFVDSIPNADSGFAETPPPEILVGFTDNSIDEILKTRIPNFKDFIAELLAQDPRPAFKRVADSLDREYGVSLYGYNVKWVVKNNKAIVISCKKL